MVQQQQHYCYPKRDVATVSTALLPGTHEILIPPPLPQSNRHELFLWHGKVENHEKLWPETKVGFH